MEQEQRALPISRREAGRAADVTRENILDAYWKLYQRGGAISVKEVMEAAGYRRSTFYLHFTGLQDVLREIEERLVCREEVLFLQVRYLSGALSTRELLREIGPLLEGKLSAWAVLLGEKGDPGLMELCEALWRPVILARLRREKGGEWAEARADFLFAGCMGALARIAGRSPEISGAQAAAMLGECLEMLNG